MPFDIHKCQCSKLGNHNGICNGRQLANHDMPAFRDLIAEVPAPSNDCVDISSDRRLGRADERWLNAWYERVQFSEISLDSVPLWFEEPCRDTR